MRTMKIRKERTNLAAWIAAIAIAVPAVPVSAQEPEPCSTSTVGELGVTGFRCDGECEAVNLVSTGGSAESFAEVGRYWLHSTEPEVVGVRSGTAVDGVLRAGDRIVSVDGRLVTTAEGSRRLHIVEPGQELRIGYRRDGRAREALVRAGSRCLRDGVQGALAGVVSVGSGRVVGGTLGPQGVIEVARGASGRARVVSVAPRAGRVGSGATVVAGVGDAQVAISRSGRGYRLVRPPSARLGLSFDCSDCVVETDEEGDVRWTFPSPISVTGVERGGPAARAGIRDDDVIISVAGHPIESAEGGVAFGAIEPGEVVEIGVLRADGRRETVRVVPEERAGAPPVVSRVRVGDTVVLVGRDAPDEGALRYTGTIGEATVEVRGEPVSVTKSSSDGTLTIYIGETTVVIRVPAGG